MSQPFDVAALAATYASKSPQEILKLAFEHFGDDLWIPSVAPRMWCWSTWPGS